MRLRIVPTHLALFLLGIPGPATFLHAQTATPPDRLVFARDILPILSNHCFRCHGPDEKERQAGLRLDERQSLIAALDSGKRAVVPGDTASSELIHRIFTIQSDELMPPQSLLKPLSEHQKMLLERWVKEGAEFQSHWSFRRPERPAIPAVTRPEWTRTPIDSFVMARWDQERLGPSPSARPESQLRRLSLDLQGLPPSLDDLEEIANWQTPDFWERMTDRYLASPRFGERFAMNWLDAARFADTNGYNNDEDRLMWRWRDWVIEAFNRDLPYDQFLIQQIGGDLMPNPTFEQRLATGFNRNHVLTTEGGIIDEEYRVEYIADRVQTTASVFMGLTLQCARCHDHKYDPISQREYYQLFAFFNQSPDKLLGYNKGAPATPFIKAPTREQSDRLDQFDRKLAAIRQQVADRQVSAVADCELWESQLSPEDRLKLASPMGLALHLAFEESEGDGVRDSVSDQTVGRIWGTPRRVDGKSGRSLQTDSSTYFESLDAGQFERDERVSYGAWVRRTSDASTTVLSRMHDSAAYRGYDLNIEAGRVAVHLVHHWPENGIKVSTSKPVVNKDVWHNLLVTYDGSSRAAGIKIYVDGKQQEIEADKDTLQGSISTDRPFHVGRRGEGNAFEGQLDEVVFYRTELTAEDVAELASGRVIAGLDRQLNLPRDSRSPEQQQAIMRYYLENVDEQSRTLRNSLADIERLRTALEAEIPTSLVMEDQADRRETHILTRGQYDQPGPIVEASVPRALSIFDASFPANRLGLARWLTSDAHPLTARVAVNRWWAAIWSTGLVETAEDFGLQGAWPSHPELLDWLAVTYRMPVEKSLDNSVDKPVDEPVGSHSDSASTASGWGWSTKRLLRMVMLSAVYRQTSDGTPAMHERDPSNRLLTQGVRTRLPAELLRDHALAASGLLVERQGGPSVMPYQPDGLWEDVSVERRVKYQRDPGAGLYRRSLYTFWKRTCPPPGMTTFDAPDREFCVIRRARTNTPAQALVLLNDPTYVEAARKLAEKVLSAGLSDWESCLDLALFATVSRPAQPEERQILREVFDRALDQFQRHPEEAEKLLAVGVAPRAIATDLSTLAAWTTVSSVLLNLDEAMTKE